MTKKKQEIMTKLIIFRSRCGREYEAEASQNYLGERLQEGKWYVRPYGSSGIPYFTVMDDMPDHWIKQIADMVDLIKKLP